MADRTCPAASHACAMNSPVATTCGGGAGRVDAARATTCSARSRQARRGRTTCSRRGRPPSRLPVPRRARDAPCTDANDRSALGRRRLRRVLTGADADQAGRAPLPTIGRQRDVGARGQEAPRPGTVSGRGDLSWRLLMVRPRAHGWDATVRAVPRPPVPGPSAGTNRRTVRPLRDVRSGKFHAGAVEPPAGALLGTHPARRGLSARRAASREQRAALLLTLRVAELSCDRVESVVRPAVGRDLQARTRAADGVPYGEHFEHLAADRDSRRGIAFYGGALGALRTRVPPWPARRATASGRRRRAWRPTRTRKGRAMLCASTASTSRAARRWRTTESGSLIGRDGACRARPLPARPHPGRPQRCGAPARRAERHRARTAPRRRS